MVPAIKRFDKKSKLKKGVSIIICCYNSEKVIEETLRSLSVQQRGTIDVEIILVDNNCKDNTVSFSQQCWKDFGAPFFLRIVQERAPGLNHARKKGVEMTAFSYFIFCDDDNRLEKNYVERVFNEFENSPNIGVLGGWSEAQFESLPPPWFESVQSGYAVGGKPELARQEVDYVWGAGMSFRTELAKKIFSEDMKTSDRKGNLLTSGGDFEICDRVRSNDYLIRKLEALKFYHFIKRERLTWHYCLHLYQGFGYSHVEYRYPHKSIRLKLGMLKSMLTFIVHNPRVVINSIMKKQGDIDTLKFYSKWGSLKASFSKPALPASGATSVKK